MFTEFAPAKINLYLHITGRRADGYHNLDSLVTFAGVGDEIRLEPAAAFAFRIEGPQSGSLQQEPPDNNLIVQAAKSLAELTGHELKLSLTLIKNLPLASGIGGGSSDAAATLRLLARHWRLPVNDEKLPIAAARHGQDVPVCLTILNNYMTATGTAPAPALPHTNIVLVNPNKALATPGVYQAYREGGYGFSSSGTLERAPADTPDLVNLLERRHNDLYKPACRLMPEIHSIIDALTQSGALLARMSGSGATCFGLYEDRAAARRAASQIFARNPSWWVVASYVPYHGRETSESS